MVLYIKSRKVFEALRKHKLVYTFRVKRRKKTSRDWVTDRRGGKKKAVVNIEEVGKVSVHDLVEYVPWSGFGSHEEWLEEIAKLNGKLVEEGWLYRVSLVGKLVVVEGIDGAGKTTIMRFLKDELERMGYEAVLLREPSDSPWGQKLRSSKSRLPPEEELELFILDRKYDVEHNIVPAMLAGKIVIIDRYYHSTMAYQGALGRDIEMIKKLNEEVAIKPDLTVILDISPEVAVERAAKRGKLSAFEKLDYLRKVRDIYLSLDDVTLIDAERPLEEVERDVLGAVLELLENSRSPILEEVSVRA